MLISLKKWSSNTKVMLVIGMIAIVQGAINPAKAQDCGYRNHQSLSVSDWGKATYLTQKQIRFGVSKGIVMFHTDDCKNIGDPHIYFLKNDGTQPSQDELEKAILESRGKNNLNLRYLWEILSSVDSVFETDYGQLKIMSTHSNRRRQDKGFSNLFKLETYLRGNRPERVVQAIIQAIQNVFPNETEQILSLAKSREIHFSDNYWYPAWQNYYQPGERKQVENNIFRVSVNDYSKPPTVGSMTAPKLSTVDTINGFSVILYNQGIEEREPDSIKVDMKNGSILTLYSGKRGMKTPFYLLRNSNGDTSSIEKTQKAIFDYEYLMPVNYAFIWNEIMMYKQKNHLKKYIIKNYITIQINKKRLLEISTLSPKIWLIDKKGIKTEDVYCALFGFCKKVMGIKKAKLLFKEAEYKKSHLLSHCFLTQRSFSQSVMIDNGSTYPYQIHITMTPINPKDHIIPSTKGK